MHTLSICNVHYFSTATMVRWTSLTVTIYVQCLSGLLAYPSLYVRIFQSFSYFMFYNEILYAFFVPHACHMTSLSCSLRVHNHNYIWGKVQIMKGARCGVMVKALRYKPAIRGFGSRWCHWNFSRRTMALGSTHPLTEMSTRCISWG